MKRRRKSRRRGHSMRGMLRRKNFPMTMGKRAAKRYAKAMAGTPDIGGYYTAAKAKRKLAAKRKRGYSLYLRRKGFGRYKGLSKKARHIGRPFKTKRVKHRIKHRPTHRKSAARRSHRRPSRKTMAAMRRGWKRWFKSHRPKRGRKSKGRIGSRRKAKGARRSARRSSHRRRGHRPSRKAIRAMQRGLRRYLRKKRALRASRLRNLRKGRRTRSRKLYGRRPLIRRTARRVKKLRPGVRISAIRRMISRDLASGKHRRGRGRSSKTLSRDAVFGIDYRRALKGQHIRPKNMRHGSWIRRMGRHPSHMRRRLTRRVVRGWKEFAGYKPNLVASFKGSPVRGQFNGVLIQKLTGVGATIVPPRGKELMFMWSNGGRTSEVVGGPAAITALAKGMAKAGRPIRLTRIDYAAMRYPVAQGARRTSRTRADVLYYHKFTHQVYLSWNGKFGTKARFPIITRGTRGACMVNRSGIIL